MSNLFIITITTQTFITMIRKIQIAIVALFLTVGVNAQSLRAYETAAVSAAEANDYAGALGYYKIIIEEAGDTKLSNYYQAAEAARMAKAFSYSESYYQYVLDKSEDKTYSDAQYWLANMQKSQGKYLKAAENFEKYATSNAANTTGLVEKAQSEVEQCNWANQVMQKPTSSNIEQLSNNVNSGYADFAPIYKDGTLYYSSIRYAAETPGQGAALGKLMSAKNEEFGVTMKGSVNMPDKHVANASFSNDGTALYYTICSNEDTGEKNCDIYRRAINGVEDFGEAEKLSNNINKAGSNNTQPNIAVDNKGNQYLFFSSNRNGGKGGMDIWMAEMKSDGGFSDPINLKDVNTNGNEVTPFFHTRSSRLYFSTDGYKSMGGLDIYSSKMTSDGWVDAKHAGYPVNGPLDDAYMSLNERGDEAYFSSNRVGATCLDSLNNCVCNDIYKAGRPVVDLIVKTYNAITKEPLEGTMVELLPKEYDPESKLDEEANEYYFGLEFENGYQVKGSKEGYTYDEAVADTYGDNTSRTITKELYLTPNVEVDALVFDQRSGEPLNGVTLELITLDNNGLVESKIELDKNNFNFPLDWKKKYRIIAKKDGYISDEVDVYTEGIPVVPTKLLENLFLCRQPFANYPFIALYFDNDFPKMTGKDRRIAMSDYEQTYKNYATEQKRSEFLNAFSNEAEKSEIRNFFDDVDEGYVRLEKFAENLTGLLSDENIRDTVVVTLKGYASPRSTPNYNIDLTGRRINSMEQYLGKYKGGLLKQFLTDGRIRIVREPYGEERAAGGSEDFNDRKASVYAIDASRERRLEIIRVTTSKYVCPDEPAKF